MRARPLKILAHISYTLYKLCLFKDRLKLRYFSFSFFLAVMGGKRDTYSMGKEHQVRYCPQEKRRRSCSANILEDILFYEILTRLPFRTLLRFKSVCRSWHDLLSRPSFISRHLDQSKKRPKVAFLPFKTNKINIFEVALDSSDYVPLFRRKFSGVRLQRPPHSNGLLVLQTRTSLKVCNPFTGEIVPVPGGRLSTQKVGFGFVSRSNVYKAARYFYRWLDFSEKTYSAGFAIFTLGVDSSWRAMAEDPPYPIDIESWPISTNEGAIYFKINYLFSKSFEKGILSFSLEHEKFEVIPLPSPLRTKTRSAHYELQQLEGNLCFVDKYWYCDKFDIWMYKGNTWEHIYNIEFPSGGVHEPRTLNQLGRVRDLDLLHVSCGKLLMYVDDYINKRLVYYDPKSKSIRHAFLLAGKRSRAVFRVFSYVESLVSIPRLVV